MNSKELWNKRRELANKVNQLIENNEMDEALRVEGQLREIDEQITITTAEEERERTSAALKISEESKSFASAILGERAAFKELEPGWNASASIKNEATKLPVPQIYRRDLPSPVKPPIGFIDTIAHGTTEGDEHFFLTPLFDNKAAAWTEGTTKPESSIAWQEASAPLQVIAHYIPILKQTARRYSTLETIISNALLTGLDLVADHDVLRGKNPTGIIGVCENENILKHRKVEGKNLKDTFAAMKRKVRVGSGIAPNYVCLSPYAIEELSEEKDKSGRYLFPDIADGGTIAGLTVVEDVNMTDEDKETALVYYSYGASFDIADPEEVTVGLVNDQFIKNAYTLLAEMTAALRVDIPGAFCYCPDLGIASENDAMVSAAMTVTK